MTTYQPNTNDSRNESLSTTKRVCIFMGNKLTLVEKSYINVNEFITSSLEDLVLEDILSTDETDFEIWKDKDITTLKNTTYVFDKFYVLTDMFLDGPYDCGFDVMNSSNLSNVDQLSEDQRVRRTKRLKKNKFKYLFNLIFDNINSLFKEKYL